MDDALKRLELERRAAVVAYLIGEVRGYLPELSHATRMQLAAVATEFLEELARIDRSGRRETGSA